jgi:tripartite-type tricarboxylate transporter receptor subunit TctC
MKIDRICRFLVTATFALAAVHGAAADWPARGVRIVVPFAAGGTTDVAARLLGQRLQEETGQSFVVENRPGASGMVGTEAVARSAADGYTLVMGSSSTFGSVKFLIPKMTYDPVADFAPVSLVATSQAFLVVNPRVPANNVQQLIEYLKKNPGKLNYSSAGNGTYHHMAGAMFASMSGVEITHVPYQGGGPGLTAVVQGQVDLMVATWSEVGGFINSDKLKVLATIGKERLASKPDMPSITEVLPGFEVPLWVGLLAPAKTPAPVVEEISRAVRKALSAESIRKRFIELGFNPVASSPAEHSAAIQGGMVKWPEIVRVSRVKVE